MTYATAQVFIPAEKAEKELLVKAQLEIMRIGASAKQAGPKGIKGLELFNKGSNIVLSLQYNRAEFWVMEVKRALKLFKVVPDRAGLEAFWDIIIRGPQLSSSESVKEARTGS